MVVLYQLTEQDAARINARTVRNTAHAGDVLPAIVVRVFGPALVNLQVLLDGEGSLWATSRHPGAEPGQWTPRAA